MKRINAFPLVFQQPAKLRLGFWGFWQVLKGSTLGLSLKEWINSWWERKRKIFSVTCQVRIIGWIIPDSFSPFRLHEAYLLIESSSFVDRVLQSSTCRLMVIKLRLRSVNVSVTKAQ